MTKVVPQLSRIVKNSPFGDTFEEMAIQALQESELVMFSPWIIFIKDDSLGPCRFINDTNGPCKFYYKPNRTSNYPKQIKTQIHPKPTNHLTTTDPPLLLNKSITRPLSKSTNKHTSGQT
jgi:hypothetical protein